MIHRIYLGGDNRSRATIGYSTRFPLADVAQALTREGFQGATLIPSYGLWEGKTEENWIIELWGEETYRVQALASILRIEFKQEAIGYSVEPSTVELEWTK